MSKRRPTGEALDAAYRALVEAGVIHEGTPEEQAAEDAALRKKWVSYESDDPLWMDLARVAARVLQGEFKDISLNMCAYFIRGLPPRIQWQITRAWRESEEPNQQLIAIGARQEFMEMNKELRRANAQRGDHFYQGPTSVRSTVQTYLANSGDWALKPPKA